MDTPASSVYQDENISVFAVPLFPDKGSNSPNSKRKEPTSSSSSPPPPSYKRKKLDGDSRGEKERRSPKQTGDHRLHVIQHMFGNALNAGPPSQSQSGPPRRKLFSIFEKPLPKFVHNPSAISYVVIGAQIRGKFDAAKAKELGLKNGPIRARLARGETVVTEDGRQITPDMVLGPAPKSEVNLQRRLLFALSDITGVRFSYLLTVRLQNIYQA